MAALQSSCEPIPDAFELLAKHLAKGDAASGALGLVTGGHHPAKVASCAELRGRSKVALLNTGSLLEAASYGQASALGLLASMSNNAGIASIAEVRRNVASASFLAQIYAELRRSELPSPMSLALQMRNILNEMDEHLEADELDLAGLGAHSSYDAELGMIASLWNAFIPARRRLRIDTLEEFARSLAGPVGQLGWDEPSYGLRKFLDACASRGLPTLELRALPPPKAQGLVELWDPLVPDAKAYAGAPVDMYCGETLEEAAQAAAAQIGAWLDQASDLPVGIVGYDRILVRRVHSLLKEKQILIKDNTGWLGNNLLVGKALLALASTSEPAALARELAHVLAASDKAGAWWPQRQGRQAGGTLNPRQQRLLAQLDLEFSSGALPPSEWFARLSDATRRAPLQGYFRNDPAGMGICTTLRMLADEFAACEQSDRIALSAAEIGRLLADTLRTTRYMVDTVQDSTVELISPATMDPKPYHGILLLGADANTLPQPGYQRLFNEDIRQHLNLPSRDDKIARSRLAAALLIGEHERVAAIWRGAPTTISPYLSLLATRQLAPLAKRWEQVSADEQAPAGRQATLARLPQRISASSGVDLVKCPYMFHAKKMLGLFRDESEQLGQRVNFGKFIHVVLNALHDELAADPSLAPGPLLAELTERARKLELGEELAKELEPMAAEDRDLFAMEFTHYHAAYAKELAAHLETAAIVEAELAAERAIGSAASQVTLQARFDRLDENRQSRLRSIVDVKTGSEQTYKDAREYPQLPIYLALTDAGGEDSAYWVLDLAQGATSIKKVRPANLSDELVANVCDDLGDMLRQAYEDRVPLPANGVAEVCDHCDYQGLCRKEHWRRGGA